MLSSIISKISWFVGERHKNRCIFKNKILFFNERYMFLVLACWDKRMLSNATCLKQISWLFKQLSLIIAEISCSVSDRRENRSSFVNKSLFFNERLMFLSLTCRVKQMLSNATSSKRYLFFHIVIIDHSQNTVFRSRGQENRRFFENKYYSSANDTCFWGHLVELIE